MTILPSCSSRDQNILQQWERVVSGQWLCCEDHENILPSHLCRMNTEHEIDILCALRILKQIQTLVSESLIVVAGDKCCSSPPSPHIIVTTAL